MQEYNKQEYVTEIICVYAENLRENELYVEKHFGAWG